MFFLHKPDAAATRALLESQAELGFTYAAVGATSFKPPKLYTVDHSRVVLGHGEKTFDAARKAIERGEHFDVGWVDLWSPSDIVQKGSLAAIVARAFGLWWFNACRVVDVVSEDGPPRKYSVTYGTLPRHAGTGEERFLIEWNRDDDSVTYDILAFSRPRGLPAVVGYYWFRAAQKRFRRDSAEAMRRAIANPQA